MRANDVTSACGSSGTPKATPFPAFQPPLVESAQLGVDAHFQLLARLRIHEAQRPFERRIDLGFRQQLDHDRVVAGDAQGIDAVRTGRRAAAADAGGS